MNDAQPYETLEKAIEVFLSRIEEPGLLMDWVVVTHKLVPNDDGTNDYSTGWVGAQQQPEYRTLGLLDHARTVVIKRIADKVDEEEES